MDGLLLGLLALLSRRDSNLCVLSIRSIALLWCSKNMSRCFPSAADPRIRNFLRHTTFDSRTLVLDRADLEKMQRMTTPPGHTTFSWGEGSSIKIPPGHSA